MAFTSFDVVERQIVEALQDVGKKQDRAHWDKREWTRRVKARVALIGEDRGYEVRPDVELESGGAPEWLYDLCWRDVGSEGELLDMRLVLESEWDRYGLIYDFEKLLVARAGNRVMIWSEADAAAFRKRVKDLNRRANACKLTCRGDRTLYCCWLDLEDSFRFDGYLAT